jgi:hypothetical protein
LAVRVRHSSPRGFRPSWWELPVDCNRDIGCSRHDILVEQGVSNQIDHSQASSRRTTVTVVVDNDRDNRDITAKKSAYLDVPPLLRNQLFVDH